MTSQLHSRSSVLLWLVNDWTSKLVHAHFDTNLNVYYPFMSDVWQLHACMQLISFKRSRYLVTCVMIGMLRYVLNSLKQFHLFAKRKLEYFSAAVGYWSVTPNARWNGNCTTLTIFFSIGPSEVDLANFVIGAYLGGTSGQRPWAARGVQGACPPGNVFNWML